MSGGAKVLNDFELEVFPFEMRIAFFSVIEGFGCFGMGILFYFTAFEEDDGCTVLTFSHSNNRKNNDEIWFQVLSQTSGNTVNTLRCQESEKDNLSY